jgi:hypothetical protein
MAPAENARRSNAGLEPVIERAARVHGAAADATVQNLTTHALRIKGVPEADIAAAINDPRQMSDLLNQLYGHRSMTADGDTDALTNRARRGFFADRPEPESNAATPASSPPFGWAGLAAFPR